ncbi:MAG TPA: RagB/SusD family nutrient uptake outer membrane protein [Candidatus Prevotella avicola]|uniref:RagB/SusD family nutrient uptake outer membrane protein n=1 Tax=Candidatus Prevotella avicola TaxID=2838738 RepID=A0A9D2FXY2_9BACT|nr:RagB/SusD family nutrient uptake outer membrane protein [Candidatus Prevotella avicola]
MKKIYNKFIMGCMMAGVTLFSASCTDYLDKSADSDVSADAAWQNYTNFQGFVEEIYNCIPDKANCNWTVSFNWGEDEMLSTNANGYVGPQLDLGNFWAWQTAGMNWFYQSGNNSTSTDRMSHSIWGHAWYCIRKANMGIANIDKMVNATQEQKNLILGQLYFFRAWWHFECMMYLGGLPYVSSVLDGTDVPHLPRLSFQECADKCAEDFRRAADLLPIDWDDTSTGQSTSGHNDRRINKIMALGYLGKVYLWSASPLMERGAMIGAGDLTYEYNIDRCKKAADALGKLLELVETGQTQYALATFDYKDIYNHETVGDKNSSYSGIFNTQNQSFHIPGGTETIFHGGIGSQPEAAIWRYGPSWGPINLCEGDICHSPTANYINYAYGMANGLPIDDPESGFDPTHPFKDRDPRFYHDIVFDGIRYITSAFSAEEAPVYEAYRYANFAENVTEGSYMMDNSGSRTGYLTQKLASKNHNKWDGGRDWGNGTACEVPYMRLADIYLMYAEACAAIDGADGASETYPSLTAEKAINTLRDRVRAGHVNYTDNKNKFMDEVRRERACELAFEGHRFCDLQRWLLLTEYPYNIKTKQVFNRVENLDWYKNPENDPRDAAVSNWGEEVIVNRKYTVRNYWFPFFKKDVSIYEGFTQNPGW